MEYAGETNKEAEGEYTPANKLDTTNKTNDDNLPEGNPLFYLLFIPEDGTNENNQNESPVPKAKYVSKNTEDSQHSSKD